MSVLPSSEQKATYVEHMFTRIAPGYDRMNRLMTFGMDDGWRSRAVETIAPPATARVLDVGCGTGAFLPLLAPWLPSGMAVGVDYTMAMLHAGQMNRARAGSRAAFVGGDALRLPFADASFNALTTGFVMRNVTDIRAAFHEMWRVARPGAVLACLEVARPAIRCCALVTGSISSAWCRCWRKRLVAMPRPIPICRNRRAPSRRPMTWLITCARQAG